uniref:Uncharacterized protein n=1 Tax=Solanum tuberosum TaxID=4113 RepID=M1DTX4_SOLTU
MVKQVGWYSRDYGGFECHFMSRVLSQGVPNLEPEPKMSDVFKAYIPNGAILSDLVTKKVTNMYHVMPNPKMTYCTAEDCSATLVEIADELGDPPFGQLIAFSVLPLASSHSRSLGGTVLLRGTDRRLADYFFPRLLIHFLQGFAYWNEGRFMSFRRLAKLNSAIRRIPFLVLFSPICSDLRLSVHASIKTSNT